MSTLTQAFVLTTLSRPLPAVTNLAYFSGNNTSSATIQWNVDPTFGFTTSSFFIYLTIPGGVPTPQTIPGTCVQINSSTFQYTFNTPAAPGSFFADVFTADGQGNFSPDTQLKFTMGTPPNPVTGITSFTLPTSSTITISWVPPVSGNITLSNNLFVATASNGPYTFLGAQNKNNDFNYQICEGLQPNTTYWFSVTAANSAGQSTFAFGGPFTTKPSPPNGAITVVWAHGIPMEVMPIRTTTHSAIYYDVWQYDSATGTSIANTLAGQMEFMWAQCTSAFLGPANNTAGIVTNINPTGLLANMLIGSNIVPPWSNGGGGFGASHASCRNADIIMNGFSSGTTAQKAAQVLTLAASELDEVFMPNLQGLPFCDFTALGEGLSQAFAIYLFFDPSIDSDGFVVSAYMNQPEFTGAPLQDDFINKSPGPYTLQSSGCNALFLNYLRVQLGFTWVQITTAINQMTVASTTNPSDQQTSTARKLYQALTGDTSDPFPTFIAKLQAHYPPGFSGTYLMNPWPL